MESDTTYSSKKHIWFSKIIQTKSVHGRKKAVLDVAIEYENILQDAVLERKETSKKIRNKQ